MPIWVDADACPNAIKQILFRAATRRHVHTTLVANQPLRLPRCAYLRALQVASGFDAADARILQELGAGDLVVTADVPLAAEAVARGALALNPRGTLYTEDNVRAHLARRDFMEELRATGTMSGGPSALGKAQVQAFANQLDRLLTRHGAAG